MSRPSRSRLPFIACVGLLALAPTGVVAAPAGPDLSPAGMVAFFSGVSSCPTGWVESTAAQGRMLVGTTTEANIGANVGTALTDLEDRAHAHSFTATINIIPKSITIGGGSTTSAVASGDHSLGAQSTGNASTNLPFVQFIACARQ